jgi:hypothetical protein
MAKEANVLSDSFIADEDLSNDQYRVVVLDTTSGKVRRPNAATDDPLGILQNAPAADEVASVMLIGVSRCQLGATLAAGARVALEYVSASDAGKIKAAATGAHPFGKLLEGGAEDELGTILIGASTVVA